MKITEGQLRRIIREELIREQGMGMLGVVANTIYGDSKDTAASGLSAPQKVAYSAAKNFLDAGQMGARQVATGKVAFDPVTFWSLSEEQKRAVFDVLSKTGNAAA